MNTASVNVTVNGAPRTLAGPATLADLIDALGQPPQALATAVNGEFVAREARGRCELHEGDAVYTFQAINGG